MDKKYIIKAFTAMLIVVGSIIIFNSCITDSNLAEARAMERIYDDPSDTYYPPYIDDPPIIDDPIPLPSKIITQLPTATPPAATQAPTTPPPVTTPPPTTPQHTQVPPSGTSTQTTPTRPPAVNPMTTPVVTPITTRIPGNAELETVYKSLLESKIDSIRELIRRGDKKWMLLSVSNVFVDLNKGEISFKAAFKYKNLWNTSRINATMCFDALINEDYSKFGIRFKELSRLKASNPVHDISDELSYFGKKVYNSLNGQQFWYKDNIPAVFRFLIQDAAGS